MNTNTNTNSEKSAVEVACVELEELLGWPAGSVQVVRSNLDESFVILDPDTDDEIGTGYTEIEALKDAIASVMEML